MLECVRCTNKFYSFFSFSVHSCVCVFIVAVLKARVIFALFLLLWLLLHLVVRQETLLQ